MTTLIRRYEKNVSTQQAPGSTIKLMTAIVAIDVLGAGDIDATVTVISSDTVNFVSNSNMQLQNGDVLSIRDLLYGLMLPSGNDAALVLARVFGGQLLVSESGTDSNATANRARFVAEMNARAADFGMDDTTFIDAVGIAHGNRSTADDLCRLMINYAEDALLTTIAGTASRTITITGANARTYDIDHTIDPEGDVLLPEFIAGKTGTVLWNDYPEESSGGCCAMLWESPTGERRVSVVMGAYPPEQRFVDLRRMIDFELARLGEL